MLRPMSPLRLTKSATLACKPVTAKVLVLAAMASAKVYVVLPMLRTVPAVTALPALVYCTSTELALTFAKPSMAASKLPFFSSNAVLPWPALRPKAALFNLA